ncbi:MAG: protein kinase [Gemmataceae bacterium]|nr:protein kinase [Gemmataceae bacterium]MCI0737940.1 protein kinase [Gemmataceae bacterium]
MNLARGENAPFPSGRGSHNVTSDSSPARTEEESDNVDSVIAEFVAAVDAGAAPDAKQWIERYPEAASALADFLADEEVFDGKVAPLRECLEETASLPPLSIPKPGARLGDYELLEQIAQGGMGVVFKARQLRLNRLVALKMIRTGPLASPGELERFRLEAEAAARLDHPNIVPIFVIDTWRQQPYFSMRLVEGGNLAQHLPRLRDDLPRATRILARIARAVHFAHERGVLHRDLKPANIMLDGDDQPHVTDFGLAKWLDDVQQHHSTPADISLPLHGDADTGAVAATPTSRLTQRGSIVGTPNYMAPEQAKPSGRGPGPTTAADVYSLGAILYEVLTGQPPIRGDTPLDTLCALLEKTPAPPRALRHDAPADLEAICLKCLEKDAARRYASAAALADDLERQLRGEPIEARPAGHFERMRRWAQRQPALAALCAVAIVALVSVSVVSVLFALREADNAAQIGRALKSTNAALGERDDALAEARAKKRLADQNLATAHEAIEEFYVKFREKGLSKVPGLQAFEKEFLQKALGYFKQFMEQKSQDPAVRFDVARAAVRVGDITHYLGEKEEALAYYDQAFALLEEWCQVEPGNAVAYQSWQAVACVNRGVVLRALLRDHEAMESYEMAATLYGRVEQARPDNYEARRHRALVYANLSGIQRGFGNLDKALEHSEKARSLIVDLLQLLQKQKNDAKAPDRQLEVEFERAEADLARAYVRLGSILGSLNRRVESQEALEKARTLQEKVVAKHPQRQAQKRELADNYTKLGQRLAQQGKFSDGLKLLEQAHAMLGALVEANPDVPEFQLSLADCCRALGEVHSQNQDFIKGLAFLREAHGRAEQLQTRFPRVAVYQNDLALCCLSLGEFHLNRKDAGQAAPYLKRAGDLYQTLVGPNPENLDLVGEWSLCLGRLSQACLQAKRPAEAIAAARQAITLNQQAVAAAARPAERRTVLMQLENLAKLLHGEKQPGEAARLWQDADAYYEKLTAKRVNDLGLQADRGRCLVLFGRDLRDHGQAAKAISIFEQGIALLEKIAKVEPNRFLPELAHAHFQFALCQRNVKNLTGELAHYEQAVKQQTEVLRLHSDRPQGKLQAHSSLGSYLNNLGLAQRRLKKLDEAEHTLRQAVHHQGIAWKASPKSDGIRRQLNSHYLSLMDVLEEQGEYAAAADAVEERRKLWSDSAKDLFFVGRDLARLASTVAKNSDQAAERDRLADLALAALEQAVQAGYRDLKELQQNPTLAVVRARPGFAKLQQP